MSYPISTNILSNIYTENLISDTDIDTEKIIFNTDKSSTINNRVREDGTLIKDVDNIKVVINRSGDKTSTNSSKSTKSFFITDPNYGPKS